MKSVSILLFLFFMHNAVPAQKPGKESFLVVRVIQLKDGWNQQNYYSLSSTGPSENKDLNTLVPYKKQFYHDQGATDFYFLQKDTSRPLYNYFRSQDEVLQYLLSDKKWQLITVINEVISDRVLGMPVLDAGFYSQVSSRPILYLKRVTTD